VVNKLGERKATVLLQTGIGTLPYTVTRFNLSAELALAGCKIALLPGSSSESVLQQHRVQVAELVRSGLPREEALKAITLRPAEILGIDSRFGTIEKGKEGDLIFLDGDPLSPDTSVTRVMTFGEIVWEAQRRP
jgi:imidazolonepropionase-like amidohydrolase